MAVAYVEKKLFSARNSSGLQSKILMQESNPTNNKKIQNNKKTHPKTITTTEKNQTNPNKTNESQHRPREQTKKVVNNCNYRTIPHLPSLSFVLHLENMGSFYNRRCYPNGPE